MRSRHADRRDAARKAPARHDALRKDSVRRDVPAAVEGGRGQRDVAIVLSGGGINGVLLELGFLQTLRAAPLWERVGWIVGTSAGALSGLMASIDRLDDLERFLLELQPEDVFAAHPLWQAPLGGLRRYALPGTITERLGEPPVFAEALAASPIELTVVATEIGPTAPTAGSELVYASRTTPPEEMVRAVLASAAVSALVLPVRIGPDTIATDGGWVRNLPLGIAYDNPEVRAIVTFLYTPSYGAFDPAPLVRFRQRLHPFRAAPPIRALIAQLSAAERRSERGEPAHLGEMIVRLTRIAIARNSELEELRADEKDLSIQVLRRLRAEIADLVEAEVPRRRRATVRAAVEARFAEARFPFASDRDLPRVTVRADPGPHGLDPGYRTTWPHEAKQALIARGRLLAADALAEAAGRLGPSALSTPVGIGP